jgi:hypothetical protein
MAYEPVTRTELLMYHAPRPGTVALRDAVLMYCAQQGAYSLGIYNRRSVAGTTVWSTHAVGRGWDCGVRGTNVHNVIEFIAACMVNGAQACGIQEVIANRRRWTEERGWQSYGGPDPHDTHIHCSQTTKGADNPAPRTDLVKWYAHFLFGV